MLSLLLAQPGFLLQPRMVAGSRPQKTDIAMPAVLGEWGMDEQTWSLVRSKKALLQFAKDGDEGAARERIEMLKKSPSIAGSNQEMPAVLGEWGMDAETWQNVRSKAALIKLSKDGNEEEARQKIASVRAAVAAEAAEAPPTGGEAYERRKAARVARNVGAAKPLGAAYELEGSLPAGVDAAAVASMLAKRTDAKKSKDFAVADSLQDELKAMGVLVNDRKRTYFAA